MIAGLLLAAGRSVRFGRDKLLEPMPDGTPVVMGSARILLAVANEVYAVIRPEQHELAEFLSGAGVITVPCPRANAGMSASIACGVRAASASEACLVALGDMPFVREDTVLAVANALRTGARIAVPIYQDRMGHPVGFSRSFYDDLTRLEGDQGARSLLKRHHADLTLVPCDDPGILRDIDRPEQLPAVSS
ncbi:MAG: nucleotidyltransferase family protein [Acidiferrobacteraceae bacterium]